MVTVTIGFASVFVFTLQLRITHQFRPICLMIQMPGTLVVEIPAPSAASNTFVQFRGREYDSCTIFVYHYFSTVRVHSLARELL